jgi:pimeloyl-ACP methyl ester carboxylesterase
MHDEFNKLQSEGIDVEEIKRIGELPAFFYGVLKINFDEIIKSFTQEVLLLTGIESGTLLSSFPDIVQKYEEAFPNAELVVVEGADHSFSRHKDKLVELVVDFINKNIK